MVDRLTEDSSDPQARGSFPPRTSDGLRPGVQPAGAKGAAASGPGGPDVSDSFKLRVLTAAALVIGLVLLLLFLWQAFDVLLLIFAGVLLAIFLRALSDGVTRVTKLSAGWSLTVVLLLIVAVVALSVWLLAPHVVEQAGQLGHQMPKAVENLKQRLDQYKLGHMVIDSQVLSWDYWKSRNILSSAGGWLGGALGGLLSLIVIVFLGLFLAFEPRPYTDGMLRLLPIGRRKQGAEVLGAINYTLRWWLIGQVIDMIAIGTATALGLWFLGIPLALMLGILAGLFNLIPNFGPIFSLAPACLLALTISPSKVLAVFILYVILQSLEGYVLQPMIQRKAVNLPPALTIATQVLMGAVVGPLGLLLATPLLAGTMVLVEMLYVDQTLGDEIETPVDKIDEKDKPKLPKTG